MPRLPTLRIATLFGIPLELNVSWFVVFVIVGWLLSTQTYPLLFPGRPLIVDLASGAVTALLFFASLVAHEFSHSLVARRLGIKVDRITLFLFGGVSQLKSEPRSAGGELRMAAAGPAMSFALAAAFLGIAASLDRLGVSSVLWAPAYVLASVNLLVGVFNLAPGFPMDGGRILRAFLWWASGDRLKATGAASLAGQGFGLLLVGAGLVLLYYQQLQGAWFVLLGLFLRMLAAASYRDQEAYMRFVQTPVSEVMAGPPSVVSSEATCEIHRELDLPPGQVAAVLSDKGIEGILWPSGDVTEPPPPDMFIDERESLETAAQRFSEKGYPGLLVVSAGRLVGYLPKAVVTDTLTAMRERFVLKKSLGGARWDRQS